VSGLAGQRILIFEDMDSICELISAPVADAGYKVIGPVRTSAAAIELASTSQVYAALLECSLRAGFSYPARSFYWCRTSRLPSCRATAWRQLGGPPDHAPFLPLA
jgi:DNA-binding response OmpR family regulator